eukprot:12375-Heterococcus_DN1.PRE.1
MAFTMTTQAMGLAHLFVSTQPQASAAIPSRTTLPQTLLALWALSEAQHMLVCTRASSPTYTQGQTITTTQTITVNHGGYLMLKVCPNSPGAATQACFNSNVLQGPNGSKYWLTSGSYLNTPPFSLAWTLPPGVSCPNGCLLQWEYTAMQSCIENCNSSICGTAYASKNNPINGQTGMPSCPTAAGPEAHVTSATTLYAGVVVSVIATVLVRLALEVLSVTSATCHRARVAASVTTTVTVSQEPA